MKVTGSSAAVQNAMLYNYAVAVVWDVIVQKCCTSLWRSAGLTVCGCSFPH